MGGAVPPALFSDKYDALRQGALFQRDTKASLEKPVRFRYSTVTVGLTVFPGARFVVQKLGLISIQIPVIIKIGIGLFLFGRIS